MAAQNPHDDLQQQLVGLEQAMMHADRLLETLNEVVCSIQDRLDEQDRRLDKLEQAIRLATTMPQTPRTLEDERPPHY